VDSHELGDPRSNVARRLKGRWLPYSARTRHRDKPTVSREASAVRGCYPVRPEPLGGKALHALVGQAHIEIARRVVSAFGSGEIRFSLPQLRE
jgi:hypothetical protein